MNVTLGIKPISFPSVPDPSGSSSAPGSFADAIGSAIGDVERTSQQAHDAAASLLAGGQGDIPAVALSAQRAELALEMFQQVRNKFVSAYQEIMKMPM